MAEMLGGLGAMVASVAIDYLAQGFYPHPVEARSAIERFGRTSWTSLQLLLQDRRPIVFARSVLVCTGDGAAAALPEGLRDGFAVMVLR
ncbi:MAG: hypothetical protein ABW203_07050 [Novosphingobium sp.]